jgi:hypothetical protein
MFGCGPLCQFANNWQNICFVMTGFDHHENRNAQQQGLQYRMDTEEVIGHCKGKRPDYPRHHQPCGEQIQALKGMEADNVVAAELAGSQHDHRGNPADGWDIAEDRGCPGSKAGERIGCGPERPAGRRSAATSRSRRPWFRARAAGRARLARPAVRAEEVCAVCLLAALGAKWHSY